MDVEAHGRRHSAGRRCMYTVFFLLHIEISISPAFVASP